jgi:hypothetical protein
MLECPDRRRFVILPASLPFIVSGMKQPFIVVAIPSLAPRSTETFARAPGSKTECPSSV